MSPSPLTHHRLVGTVLSHRWLIQRVIAESPSAIVCAARHRNGSRVALKLTLGPAEALDHESLLTSAAEHDGVVRVLGGEVDPQHGAFLILELLEGATLRDFIARGAPIALAAILEIAGQAHATLEALHRRGIVHGDVAEQHVFVCRDGGVKLVDFACASLGGEARNDVDALAALTRRLLARGVHRRSHVDDEVTRLMFAPAGSSFGLGASPF